MSSRFNRPARVLGIAALAAAASGLLVVSVVILLGAGCGWGIIREVPAPQVPPPPTVAPSQVGLRTVDRTEFDRWLQGQQGKVVLVDFWSTSCEPCLRLMPHTTALGQRLADRGLCVATVSLDPPSQEGQVRTVLANKGAAAAVNFLARAGGGPRVYEEFEIDDGALPHVRIYGRDGKLLERIVNGDEARVQSAVERLLGAQPAETPRSGT